MMRLIVVIASEVIEHVMAGNHALVIMPTGMGKSLCYQIPALAIAQDTYLDTFTSSSYSNNDGSANFVSRSGFSTGGLAEADVDGDGDYDLISSAEFEDSVYWHENIDVGESQIHTITDNGSRHHFNVGTQLAACADDAVGMQARSITQTGVGANADTSSNSGVVAQLDTSGKNRRRVDAHSNEARLSKQL